VDGLLSLPDGRPFATGAATYSVGQPGAKMAGRILLQVSVEGVPTIAAVDTGGYYAAALLRWLCGDIGSDALCR
jgi:hypothetical protein